MIAEQTTIDLMRHGETVAGNLLCGVTDAELSVKGKAQMQNSLDKLLGQGSSWHKLYYSPLKRCAQFARNIGSRSNMTELSVECLPGLREVDFGSWDGMSLEVISQKYPRQWQSWLDDPQVAAPHGGECFAEFRQRVEQSLQYIMNQAKGKKVLLIIHGGVARVIFAHLFHFKINQLASISFAHACVSRIMVYHQPDCADWFQLEAHNFI